MPRSRETGFDIPLYNVWKQQTKTEGAKHFGDSEIKWLDNLLYLYTAPFDIVAETATSHDGSIRQFEACAGDHPILAHRRCSSVAPTLASSVEQCDDAICAVTGAGGMAKHSIDDWLGALFGVVAVLPSACSIGVGALIILGECVNWLKTAVWQTPTLRDGLVWWFGLPAYDIPQTGYLGVNQLLHWALDSLPLALWLIIIGPAAWLVVCILIFNLLFTAAKVN